MYGPHRTVELYILCPLGICFELNRFAPCGYSRAGATGDYQVWAWKGEGGRKVVETHRAFGIIWVNVRFQPPISP